MTKIQRSLRRLQKSSTQYPGVIVDVAADGRATVRLSRGGATYRLLPVVGGPVTKGQSVYVDFTTPTPTIQAPGVEQVAGISGAALRQRKAKMTTSAEPDLLLICVYEGPDPKTGRPTTTLRSTFPVTDQGLTDALEFAEDGNTVYLPPCSISGDHLVPFATRRNITLAGTSLTESVLTGELEIGESCFVRDLTVSTEGVQFCVTASGSCELTNVKMITNWTQS